jgi:hypothetical protein
MNYSKNQMNLCYKKLIFKDKKIYSKYMKLLCQKQILMMKMKMRMNSIEDFLKELMRKTK